MINKSTPLTELQLSFSELSLGNAQREFTKMVTQLLVFAHLNDYSITLGDAFRDRRVFTPDAAYGKIDSNHKRRLAIDLNLFTDIDNDGDQDWLSDTLSHQPLGEFWESIGGYWGGRHGDGNHYTILYRGKW